MLRLWPDALQARLFAGNCWLAKTKGKRDMLGCVSAVSQTSDLLQSLDQCLIQAEGKLNAGANLSLVVSDNLAAIVPLPWQNGLHSQLEQQGYARLCFEALGQEIGEDWALHVEYRRYGAPGLAYALPRDWMASLLARLEQKRIRLSRILPISAAAFTGKLGIPGSGLTIVLLIEAIQHCALVYRGDVLIERDVEPFTQSIEKTCHRLLARTLARQKAESKDALNLYWWAYTEIEFPKDVVHIHAVDAKVSQILEMAWS